MVPSRAGFLGHNTQMAPQFFLTEIPDINAVDEHLTAGGIVDPGDQLISVVLPEPVEPMMAVVSPGRVVKLTCSSTGRSASG